MEGGDSHVPSSTVGPHLNPRTIPEVHHQTQSIFGSDLNPEPQTRKCLSISLWKAMGDRIRGVLRAQGWEGSGVTLSVGPELLVPRPGRGEAEGAGRSGRKAVGAVGRGQSLRSQGSDTLPGGTGRSREQPQARSVGPERGLTVTVLKVGSQRTMT